MSIFTEPRLSACIVLYNSGMRVLHTVQCFQESTIALELHVVDNAPGGTLGEHLQWQCPGVQYYPQRKNLGYGKANNVVLPNLRSEYHLICNPDVTFSDTLLEDMVSFMDQHPECVILTPKVLNTDGTEQFLPRLTPTVRYLLGGRLEKLPGPFKKWRGEYTLKDYPVRAASTVEFATGCFLLIRTAALRQLNGFDPRFFLYHEDSDLSRRAMEIGQIVYNPDMVITHDWRRESSTSFKHTLYHIASTFRYFAKWGWKW